MLTPQVLVFETLDALYQTAAAYVKRTAEAAVQARDRFTFALSGGGTPGPIYELLAQPPYSTTLPWAKTHVFWGDERLVPADAPGSSYHQAWTTLLAHVPLPAGNIHRLKGELPPPAAAADYAQQLAALAEEGQAWPSFDLVLLGLGSDGHTASLFPAGTQPQYHTPTLAVTADYAGRPAGRVTLTPLVFNAARNLLFLATGAEKAAAIAATLDGPFDPARWPAQRLQPDPGRVTWLIDRPAAQQLHHQAQP